MFAWKGSPCESKLEFDKKHFFTNSSEFVHRNSTNFYKKISKELFSRTTDYWIQRNSPELNPTPNKFNIIGLEKYYEILAENYWIIFHSNTIELVPRNTIELVQRNTIEFVQRNTIEFVPRNTIELVPRSTIELVSRISIELSPRIGHNSQEIL